MTVTSAYEPSFKVVNGFSRAHSKLDEGRLTVIAVRTSASTVTVKFSPGFGGSGNTLSDLNCLFIWSVLKSKVYTDTYTASDAKPGFRGDQLSSKCSTGKGWDQPQST